jgi:hypothetical protein
MISSRRLIAQCHLVKSSSTRSQKLELAMLGKVSLMIAILATVSLLVTEAFASPADGHRNGYRANVDHRGHRSGYYAGYGVHYYHPGFAAGDRGAATTVGDFLERAIYGYPYGTPCYRYNDRDWDYERVC